MIPKEKSEEILKSLAKIDKRKHKTKADVKKSLAELKSITTFLKNELRGII